MSKSDQCYVATRCGRDKKKDASDKRTSLGEPEKHTFSLGFPVKHHHRAWLGGYVHSGPIGVQAAIQERQSVPFTGQISDYLTRRASRSTGGVEGMGRSIYDELCDISRDIPVAGERGETGVSEMAKIM